MMFTKRKVDSKVDSKNRFRRPTEYFQVEKVLFLCEQEGPSERLLKAELMPILATEPSISRAYLARIRFDKRGAIGVALCLSGKPTAENELVENVGKIFASLGFGRSEHLDIIFLSDEEEIRIGEVCKPFFLS